jgi:hypothetical protein
MLGTMVQSKSAALRPSLYRPSNLLLILYHQTEPRFVGFHHEQRWQLNKHGDELHGRSKAIGFDFHRDREMCLVFEWN